MPTPLIIAIVAIVVIVVLAAAYMQAQRNERERLRERFGAEYDRTVAERGDRSAAEKELSSREKRVRSFSIRPASPDEWVKFSRSWTVIQAEFVDDPAKSVQEADQLVGSLLETTGYPPADFEQRVADISVDHPAIADTYRQAHQLTVTEQDGDCRTEELREAMVSYHKTFDDLLGRPPAPPAPPARDVDVEAEVPQSR